MSRPERIAIAKTRLHNILRSHGVANSRTLEQKISDAGPNNQRVDPHILTRAREELIDEGSIVKITRSNIPWYYLQTTDPSFRQTRLFELGRLYDQTQHQHFNMRIGQALEIAILRGLRVQERFQYFGDFPDLDAHDDSTLYRKEEPPMALSSRRPPGSKVTDFILHDSSGTYAAIEAKNARVWFYPHHPQIRDHLLKCCSLDVVPVLIARRIHYSTFSVLNPCGVVLHQTFNQLYPVSARVLAEHVADKRLLGYHDVRVGNQADGRLLRFLHQNLPAVLPDARKGFNRFKDLVCDYATEQLEYAAFAGRVKRRLRGESETFTGPDEDYTGADLHDFGAE